MDLILLGKNGCCWQGASEICPVHCSIGFATERAQKKASCVGDLGCTRKPGVFKVF